MKRLKHYEKTFITVCTVMPTTINSSSRGEAPTSFELDADNKAGEDFTPYAKRHNLWCDDEDQETE
jgi:hypothetical protein